MRFGITSTLLRLRTMQPDEAARVARAVVLRVRGIDERSLVDLLEAFSEGQLLAFDSKDKLVGWALHLRVSEAAGTSLRRVGTPPLAMHDPQGTMLMPFETETPSGMQGAELREALDVARHSLVTGLGIQRILKGVVARITQVA